MWRQVVQWAIIFFYECCRHKIQATALKCEILSAIELKI